MPDKPNPSSLVQRLFNTCLFLLGSVIVLYLALELLAQFWGWLILIAVIVGVIWALIIFLRVRRDRW